MKTLERYSQYIILPKSITQATIAEARFAFTSQFGRQPREIRVGSKALRDMFAEIGINNMPVNFSNESVQGLLIMTDGTLKPDEWLVGYSDEIIRAVKK